jgi:small-conductance mechanosensitive channel
MTSWAEMWRTQFFGNTVGDWTLGVIAFLVTFTVLPLIRGYISAQRRRWLRAGRELPIPVQLLALLIARTSKLFLLTLALKLAFTQVELPPRVEKAATTAIVLTFWFQFGLWLMAAVRFGIETRARRAGADSAISGSFDIIRFIASILVWSLALLLALDNLGIQIKPLLAGLGIGGIAVALAVQNVLGDLFASLSIALDKPFGVGDALQVDNISGTVEHIGVKSTRIRATTGEQIIISNADLLKSRLHNNARMQERRSAFVLNVTYDTPPEKLRAIPAMVREIVAAQPQTRFDRCHFLAYTDWALRFEVVYFVTVADFNTYANAQQAINLGVLERFRAMGIEFAFPSRPFDPASLHAPGSQPEIGTS